MDARAIMKSYHQQHHHMTTSSDDDDMPLDFSARRSSDSRDRDRDRDRDLDRDHHDRMDTRLYNGTNDAATPRLTNGNSRINLTNGNDDNSSSSSPNSNTPRLNGHHGHHLRIHRSDTTLSSTTLDFTTATTKGLLTNHTHSHSHIKPMLPSSASSGGSPRSPSSSCSPKGSNGSLITTSQGSNGSVRKRGRPLPDELKDEAYWERRRKNNEAAKRSRDARRAKESEVAIRAAFLEQENLQLRVEVAALKTEVANLRCLLYANNQQLLSNPSAVTSQLHHSSKTILSNPS